MVLKLITILQLVSFHSLGVFVCTGDRLRSKLHTEVNRFSLFCEKRWTHTSTRTHCYVLMTSDGPSHKTAKPSIQLAGGISHPMTCVVRCLNRVRIWINVTILCDPCARRWARFYLKDDKCNAPVSVDGKMAKCLNLPLDMWVCISINVHAVKTLWLQD